MPGVYQLEWRNGQSETIYGHRGYYYVFDDSTVLSFLPVPAWCHSCGKIALCEKLDSPGDIKAELEQLNDPESEMSQQLRRSPVASFPEDWKHRREMDLLLATQRTEPASCLTCGGRRVSHFTADVWMTHPETGEEVRLTSPGMCSTGFAMKFYDLEGNLIDIGDKEKKRLMASGSL